MSNLEAVAKSLIAVRELWFKQLTGHISQGLVRTAGDANLTEAPIVDIEYLGKLSFESKVGFDGLNPAEQAALLYQADILMKSLAENGFDFEILEDDHDHDDEETEPKTVKVRDINVKLESNVYIPADVEYKTDDDGYFKFAMPGEGDETYQFVPVIALQRKGTDEIYSLDNFGYLSGTDYWISDGGIDTTEEIDV